MLPSNSEASLEGGGFIRIDKGVKVHPENTWFCLNLFVLPDDLGYPEEPSNTNECCMQSGRDPKRICLSILEWALESLSLYIYIYIYISLFFFFFLSLSLSLSLSLVLRARALARALSLSLSLSLYLSCCSLIAIVSYLLILSHACFFSPCLSLSLSLSAARSLSLSLSLSLPLSLSLYPMGSPGLQLQFKTFAKCKCNLWVTDPRGLLTGRGGGEESALPPTPIITNRRREGERKIKEEEKQNQEGLGWGWGRDPPEWWDRFVLNFDLSLLLLSSF